MNFTDLIEGPINGYQLASCELRELLMPTMMGWGNHDYKVCFSFAPTPTTYRSHVLKRGARKCARCPCPLPRPAAASSLPLASEGRTYSIIGHVRKRHPLIQP
jgi:hypothetical protein